MSFLDIMFCGFGGVVLLVMILNGKTLQKREETQKRLQAEVTAAVQARETAESDVLEMRQIVDELQLQEGDVRRRANRLQANIDQRLREAAVESGNGSDENLDRAREVAQLQRQKSELERQLTQQGIETEITPASPGKLIGFDGAGRRQYLTGLKLGGERTLLLVDASASMLDETIVNVVRRKLMSEPVRRQAPKWQRAVRSVHWILANLQENKQFQVYVFNEAAYPVLTGSEGRWLNTGDADRLRRAIESTADVAPLKGTNLHSAFQVVDSLDPPPDSVVLITDGLPTLGLGARATASVSPAKRRRLFEAAARRLKSGVPVNVLLFPMEGDPEAAEAYWSLAIASNGSFITPSRDWP